MGLPLRIKLIGGDGELLPVREALARTKLPFGDYSDLDDACDSQESDPADVFILGGSNYFQSSLNQIHKLNPEPEVLLATGDKIPNLAKILAPQAILHGASDAEIRWHLEHASEVSRRKRRLNALRDHHKRSWSQ